MSRFQPLPNRRLLAIIVAAAAIVIATPKFSIAAPNFGGKCTKANSFKLINKKVAICIKKGNSLIWSSANAIQKENYKKLQTQILITSREKNLVDLRTLRDRNSDVSLIVPQWNAVLIQKKSELITVARQQLADLGAQKNEQEQIIKNAQNNLDAITTSINSTQGTLNSLQNQINTQQAAVNSAKAYNDSAYNIYVSAKAQSDFLSYSYQSALNSNSSMLAAKVLCDFGFGSCGVYNSSQYSYNASIISQYNAASARTSSTYASYTNYNSQYSASLNTLNSLKNQQAQTANILTNLNSQKNQLTSNISAANSKIISLSLQISQALIKFSPLEAAESRIKSDQTIYSETKGAIEARCAEFIAEINDFLLIANQEFIEKASAIDWEVKYTGILDKQRDIELKISNLKDLVSKLDGYLASL